MRRTKASPTSPHKGATTRLASRPRRDDSACTAHDNPSRDADGMRTSVSRETVSPRKSMRCGAQARRTGAPQAPTRALIADRHEKRRRARPSRAAVHRARQSGVRRRPPRPNVDRRRTPPTRNAARRRRPDSTARRARRRGSRAAPSAAILHSAHTAARCAIPPECEQMFHVKHFVAENGCAADRMRRAEAPQASTRPRHRRPAGHPQRSDSASIAHGDRPRSAARSGQT